MVGWLDGKLGLDRITFPGICPRFFASHGGGQQHQLGCMCTRMVGWGIGSHGAFGVSYQCLFVLSSILQSCVNLCQY